MRRIVANINLEAETVDGLCAALEQLIDALCAYDDRDEEYDFTLYENSDQRGYTISADLT